MEHEIIKIEREVADLKADQSALAERVKTLFTHVEKQDKLIDTVNNLALSLKGMVEKMAHVEGQVNGLCADVAEIKQKPAKRWDSIIEKALMLIVGALVGLILTRIGLQ